MWGRGGSSRGLKSSHLSVTNHYFADNAEGSRPSDSHIPSSLIIETTHAEDNYLDFRNDLKVSYGKL